MQERVLVVGGGEAGQFIAWSLQNGNSRGGFRIVGCVDDDLYKQDMRIYGMNVLGRRDDIPRLVEKHDVGIIIFAIHNISNSDRRQVLDICNKTSAQVLMMPDFLAELRGVVNGNVKDHSTQRDAPSIKRTIPTVAWLDELEQAVASGNFEVVKEIIREMRIDLGERTI